MQITQDDAMNVYFVLVEAQANAEYDRNKNLELGIELQGDKRRLDRINDLVGKFQMKLFGRELYK
jgi:hypothetical protein